MVKYASWGIYALPLAIAGAWFLHFPAVVGIPLALIGIASGAVLYFDKHPMSGPPSAGGKGGNVGSPPKTK